MAALLDAWVSVKEDIADLCGRLDDAIAAHADDGDTAALKAEVASVVDDMKAFDAEYDAEFYAEPPILVEAVVEE